MKLNKIIISSIIALATLGACREDFLDEKPVNRLALEDAITNEGTLTTAVNGLYNFLGTPETFGGNIQTLNELLGDNAFVSSANSGRFSTTRNTDLSFFTTQNGYFRTIWEDLYRTINNTNIILSFEGKIPDDPNVSGTPDNLFAQAKAVRALCYYQLVNFYSEDYGRGNQDLGVPIVLDFNVERKPARNTIQEVYTQILKDLNEAEGTINNSNNKKIGKTAVQLLLSRVYLSQKNYTKANEYAQLVLDNASHTLLPASQVSTFFTLDGESNSETIFQIDYNTNKTNGSGFVSTWYSGGTYRQNFATRAFYDKLDDKDVRKNTWYKITGASVTRDGVDILQTYPDTPKPVDVWKYTSNVRDAVILRKTEAVFNQIEALYHTNPTLAAERLQTWVSANRIEDYTVTATGTALLQEILFQKNIEFFLEGFRYQDLKRNGLSYTNPQTGVTLTPNDVGFKAFYIPEYETNNNTNIKQFPTN
ncbi:MAG: RagB/SusD family nutrient uptake outer membrane protein [Cruoricaptor ignavus]|nr:RagB/SusD family nutrient uptake outer membrane protein [Cruoricaptor ignavus]